MAEVTSGTGYKSLRLLVDTDTHLFVLLALFKDTSLGRRY